MRCASFQLDLVTLEIGQACDIGHRSLRMPSPAQITSVGLEPIAYVERVDETSDRFEPDESNGGRSSIWVQ